MLGSLARFVTNHKPLFSYSAIAGILHLSFLTAENMSFIVKKSGTRLEPESYFSDTQQSLIFSISPVIICDNSNMSYGEIFLHIPKIWICFRKRNPFFSKSAIAGILPLSFFDGSNGETFYTHPCSCKSVIRVGTMFPIFNFCWYFPSFLLSFLTSVNGLKETLLTTCILNQSY